MLTMKFILRIVIYKIETFTETMQIYTLLLDEISKIEDFSEMIKQKESNEIFLQIINNCLKVCCIINQESNFTEIQQTISKLFGNKYDKEFIIQYASWYIQKQEFHLADRLLSQLPLSSPNKNFELIFHFSYLRALEYFISKNFQPALDLLKTSEVILDLVPSFPLLFKYEFYFNYCLANLNIHDYLGAQKIYIKLESISQEFGILLKRDDNDPIIRECTNLQHLLSSCLPSKK